MRSLILINVILLLINQNNFQIDQINYYYFTAEYCLPCKKQLPIIIKLQEEGFDFEILDDQKSFQHYKIESTPTIIIELVDYKKREVKQIRIVGLHSYDELIKLIKIKEKHGQEKEKMD